MSLSPASDRDEFASTPEAVEACWRGSFSGDDDAYRTELLEDLAATIDWCFNPRDDDVAVNSILIDAVLGAAAYIASLPCTCAPGDDDGPCDRCSALGRWHDESCER